MKKIIATAAYPFVPAELNMAHMASTFIPADVYSRFIKAMGYECIFVSATDVHGVGVQQLVKNNDKDEAVLIKEYDEKYKHQFDMLSICYDAYGRTDSVDVKNKVYSTLKNLYNKGFIIRKKSRNYFCAECDEYLPKRYRMQRVGKTETNKIKVDEDNEEIVCSFCGNTNIEIQDIDHYFLDIPKAYNYIKEVVENQESKYVFNILNGICESGLNEWDFTRDNYCGIEFPFGDEKLQYVYLWYESLVAYMTLTDETDSFEFRHFIGKNIVYYHGIVWPLILNEGFDSKDINIQITARGFLNISKSDSDMIDIENVVSKYNSDYVRFYIMYVVQDNISDFRFTEAGFKNVINKILCKRIGGFLHRIVKILKKSNATVVPYIEEWDENLENIVNQVNNEIKNANLNKALNLILDYIKMCGTTIENNKMYVGTVEKQIAILCKMLATTLIMLAPYIPNLIENFNIFVDFKVNSYDSLDSLQGKKIGDSKSIWEGIDE